MKKISRILKSALFIVLAVSMMFGVVACQKGENYTSDGEPVVKGKVEVTVRREAYATESALAGVRSWIEAFEKKYPEADVKMTVVSQENYPALFSSGTMGDAYALHDEVVYDYAIAQQALFPLDYYIEKFDIDISQIYNGIYQLGVVNGKTYFAAGTCGQQTFIYNVDALKAENVLPAGQDRIANDWTWDDFKKYVAATTKIDANSQYTQVGAAFPVGFAHYYSPFFVGFGGKWVDTVNKKVTLTDAGVIKGLGELFGVLEKGYVNPLLGDLGTEWNRKFANVQEYQAYSVFQFSDSFTTLSTKGMILDQMGIQWDVATFPLMPENASPCGTLGFGVFSGAKNKDAAAALVCSLYTEDGQRALHSQTGGDVPTIKTLGEDDFWHLDKEGWEDKNYSAFTANYDRYIPGHIKVYTPYEISDIVHTMMNQMFVDWYQGKADWQDTLAAIEETANNKWLTLS